MIFGLQSKNFQNSLLNIKKRLKSKKNSDHHLKINLFFKLLAKNYVEIKYQVPKMDITENLQLTNHHLEKFFFSSAIGHSIKKNQNKFSQSSA